MKRTTCPDNAGLVRLAETDQADGQHLYGVSAVRLPRPGRENDGGLKGDGSRIKGRGAILRSLRALVLEWIISASTVPAPPTSAPGATHWPTTWIAPIAVRQRPKHSPA